MDPVRNPFRPGAGRRPPLLAGREPILDAFAVVRDRAEQLGEGDRGWILHGLRGVGKTVLFAKVEASPTRPLAAALAASLVNSLRTATGRHPIGRLRQLLGVFKAFSLKVDPLSGALSLGVDVQPIHGIADTGQFEHDLAALFELLGETSRELGIGTLILVDELQEASSPDLAAVNAAVHHAGQAADPQPVFFVGAGLPSLPAQLAEATSYAERLYDYRAVGLLDQRAATAALTAPVDNLGAQWTGPALQAALDIAAGYPYFIQSVGKQVWDAARTAVITVDDVTVGGAAATREISEGLYRSRWERATPSQRLLLRAVAESAGDRAAAISEIATRMGRRRASDLSVARDELIKKGLLYAPERGMLAFTVPGMHTYITNQG